MKRICINGRDELMMIDLSRVACFKADIDYTTLYFIGGLTALLPVNLAKVEAMVAAVPKSEDCDFFRLGRSCIINKTFLYRINTLQQKLILSDGHHEITLNVAKDALKKYKQIIAGGFSSPTNLGD